MEQFDVQQPELTIRETVEFCAQLRLDAKDPMIGNDEGKKKYAAYVLGLMELTEIQNLQVGSFAEGGLTFEQRKRLSIACELAGSPSVIFLDGKEKSQRILVTHDDALLPSHALSFFEFKNQLAGLIVEGPLW